MVYLGHESGAAVCKAQTNPLSYGGTPGNFNFLLADAGVQELEVKLEIPAELDAKYRAEWMPDGVRHRARHRHDPQRGSRCWARQISEQGTNTVKPLLLLTPTALFIEAKCWRIYTNIDKLTSASVWPVVEVIKLFWRKSGKSRFPVKLKQWEKAILKAINSFTVLFCLNSIVFTFLCRFRHQNKLFSMSKLQVNLDYLQKKVL